MECAALTNADLHRLEACFIHNHFTRSSGSKPFTPKFSPTTPTHRPFATRKSEHWPTKEVAGSRFESNSEQPGKELCFYEGFCLQGWQCKVTGAALARPYPTGPSYSFLCFSLRPQAGSKPSSLEWGCQRARSSSGRPFFSYSQ